MTRIRGKTASTWGKRSEWWDGASKVDRFVRKCEARMATGESGWMEDGTWREVREDGSVWYWAMGKVMGSSSSEGEQGRQAEGGSSGVEQGSEE